MKRLLYPLLASALVTISPFLISFEKGQDIVRGLFGYSEFGLLLLFVWARSVACKKTWRSVAGFTSKIGLFLIVAAMVVVSWIDLLNLLALKGGNVGWYGILPFLTCAVAIAMVFNLPHFKLTSICTILFVTLFAHLEWNSVYPAQPLAQFPVVDYLSRSSVPVELERKNLSEAFKAKYLVTDSVTITRDYLDTSRNNVVILVESWGIPIEMEKFEQELSVFDGIPQQRGVHPRMYSRTRTAEREDLLLANGRDSLGRRDSTFLPKVLLQHGVSTTFLFGGDSLEQWRYKYVHNVGFENVVWKNAELDIKYMDDASMVLKVDSILKENDENRKFVAWTTCDTKFPLSEFKNPYAMTADTLNVVYMKRLMNTLRLVADLARKNPEVRFIVQGDHEPILSPVSFQERFYKRWVPFVVLN